MDTQSQPFTPDRILEVLALSQNAIAIYSGEELTIQSANDAMLQLWGKNKDVIGQPLGDVMAERIGHPSLEIIRKVWHTGVAHEGIDFPFKSQVNGESIIVYLDVYYKAVHNDQGEVECVLHTANDVTELNIKRRLNADSEELKFALEREHALNAELRATNDELAAANAELAKTMETLNITNEELLRTKSKMQILNDQLELRVESRTKTIESLNQELQDFNLQLRSSNAELAEANIQFIATNEELNVSRQNLQRSLVELNDSESRTRSIIEAAPFPIGIYTGREMRVSFANKSIIDVWGKGDDVVGKLFSEIVPEASQEIFAQLDQVFITGTPFDARNQEIRLLVDGAIKVDYFNYNFTALRNNSGEIYGVMNTAAEVTDVVLAKHELEKSARALAILNNQLAEVNEELQVSNDEQGKANLLLGILNEKLKVSQQEFQLAIEAAGLATFDYNLTNGKYSGNNLLKTWFGLQPEDELSLGHAMSVIHEADRERVTAAFAASLSSESGGDYDVYYTITTQQSRQPRIVRAKGKAIFNKRNEPVRFTGVVQDVTVQTTSENKMHDLIRSLEASEKRFRLLIKQAPVAINVFKTRELIIESINDKMLEIWGKTYDVNGLRFSEALPEMLDQPFLEILDNVFTTGKPFYGLEQKGIIEKNGVPVEGYFNFVYQPIKEDNGTVNSILQVVSEVTEEVNSRKEIADINTRLTIAIDAGSLGYTEVDLATGTMESNERFKKCFGRKPDEIFSYPDLLEAMLPKYRENIRELVAAASKNHSIYQAEYEIAWPDGSIHWIRAHGQARYDNTGTAVKLVGMVSDITELKADEQRKNDFIGMVSHELKTPLTSISAYVQMLQARAPIYNDPFVTNALDMANKQVKKMSKMISGFLDISRLESGKLRLDRQRFDLATLIKEVKEESIVTITTHKVIFAPVEEIFVFADRDKIGQVVNNFLTNAVKYSAPGTTINVACVAEKNNYALIAVQDEGRGISPEDQQRIFERYYRIKDQPATISGFGIGLYVCAELITQHNGKIWVDSEVGVGSTFNFSLPI